MSARNDELLAACGVSGCVHGPIRGAARGKISAILWEVGKLLSLLVLIFAAACVGSPLRAAQPSPVALPSANAAQQPDASSPPAQHPQFPPPNAAPAPGSPSPVVPAPVIVLDPAHGGTNTGARGENGLVEKDLVLQIARTLQAQLQNHGYRVVMTRTDDSNPSYDDRAAIANAYHNAIFITLHVGSTGKVGTVRAFYDEFWTPIPAMPSSSPAAAPGEKSAPSSSRRGPAVAKLAPGLDETSGNTLLSWQQAQRPYVDASHRLADLLQLQFAQTFPGSPTVSTAVPLRDLRSVAGPAVAVEIANVSAPSADTILALAGPLSLDIERAVQGFRQAAAGVTP